MSDLDHLIKKLREEGSTGLDLSPGQPYCRDAAIALESLRARVAELERMETEQRRLKEIYYNAGADCGAEAEAAEARVVELEAEVARRRKITVREVVREPFTIEE